jgi:uncharacterized protein (DUF697 family)
VSKMNQTKPDETPNDDVNETAAETVEEAVALDEDKRLAAANAIITRNIYWAVGLGTVPFPLFDLVAISALQVKMIKELSELYGVTFSKNLAVNSVAALVGGIGPVELAKVTTTSLVKSIPGVGTALGIVALPALGGAATYAIGHIYILHFESGGTFLDFDPRKAKEYYRTLLAKGKGVVNSLKKEPETVETAEAA